MARRGRSKAGAVRKDDVGRAANDRQPCPQGVEEPFVQGRPKVVRVKFTAKDNEAYEMWQDGKKVEVLKFNKCDHNVNGEKMKKTDHFIVEFSLDDQTSAKNLEVPPNPVNAIWICTPRQSDPPGCPKNPSYDQQIYAIGTDPQRGTLSVRNEDREVEEFKFTLRFLRRDMDPSNDSSYESYDPGGMNENGGAN